MKGKRICQKCHRRQKRSYYTRHTKTCHPTKDDIAQFTASKSSQKFKKKEKGKETNP